MSLPSPEISVTSPIKDHHQMVRGITENLNEMGHRVLPDEVIAYNQDTPIQETPQMKQTGVISTTASDLGNEIHRIIMRTEDTRRITESINPFNILLKRRKQII